MTGENLAAEATKLLMDPSAAARMRDDLAGVRKALLVEGDPMERAAQLMIEKWEGFASNRNRRQSGHGV
jgi:hypothetical protein